MNENLGKQVRSGFGWDLTGTFFKQISTLIVSVILARLLTPEEFGIIGMAMVFVSLSQIFVEVGFSQGLIQSEHNSQRAYSSVFYLTFALGLIVGALIYFTAPLVGLFFESDKVSKGEYTEVIRWLSLVPIISSFGSIHNTRFVRNLQFKILAFRNVLSTVLGGIVGVVMAYLGYGVYALVGQQLTTISLFVIILWWKSDWFPTWEFSFEEIKQLINFSGYVFLNNLLRKVFLKIDTLFIGKYFSAATLGYYSRAESLNSMVMQYTTASLRTVLFPALSKLQKDPKRFEESFFKVFNISTFLGTIICGILFFLSEEIIITLLGEIWRPSILIFQILVFRLIVSPFGALISKSLLAKGYSKQTFQFAQLRRLILLFPLVFGYFYDIYAFTTALVVAHFLGFLISIWSSHKYLNIPFTTQLTKFFVPMIPLLVMVYLNFIHFKEFNSFLLLVIFLVIQIGYFILIKSEGMYLSIGIAKSFLKKK